MQCYSNPPPDRPLQTRPGLCPHHPLHPPNHHVPLRPLHPGHALLVASAGRFRCANGLARHVGVPVARVAADGIWREAERAG